MSSGSHRPPPTVLLKQEQYEPFGEKICQDKLQKVGRSSDSIRQTAAWVYHHRQHLPNFVKIWIAQFRRASPLRRLSLYYVAHETLALCKKKNFDKGFSCFQSVLREATVYSRDKECKIGVRKVFNIFADAAFFPEEFLQSLREDLERPKSTLNYNKTVLADFDPAVIGSINDHMQQFRKPGLDKLETLYAQKKLDLQIGAQVISKIKEHAAGKEHLQQFDSAFSVMTELADAHEQDLQYEYDLVNQLELLRVFYSTTTKEAGKVIVAYRNYEYAAQNGMKHLEKARNLLSIPLPAMGATKSSPVVAAAPAVVSNVVLPPTEIETVDMDMDMSDEEDAGRASQKLPNLQVQPPPPPTSSTATGSSGSQPTVSLESILSAFSLPQHCKPPFGVLSGAPSGPQQRPPIGAFSHPMQYSGPAPGSGIAPHQRLPNKLRPALTNLQSPQEQSSRPNAPQEGGQMHSRFFSPGPSHQQQPVPTIRNAGGGYDKQSSNRFASQPQPPPRHFEQNDGGANQQRFAFRQNGPPGPTSPFMPAFDGGAFHHPARPPKFNESPGGRPPRPPGEQFHSFQNVPHPGPFLNSAPSGEPNQSDPHSRRQPDSGSANTAFSNIAPDGRTFAVERLFSGAPPAPSSGIPSLMRPVRQMQSVLTSPALAPDLSSTSPDSSTSNIHKMPSSPSAIRSINFDQGHFNGDEEGAQMERQVEIHISQTERPPLLPFSLRNDHFEDDRQVHDGYERTDHRQMPPRPPFAGPASLLTLTGDHQREQQQQHAFPLHFRHDDGGPRGGQLHPRHQMQQQHHRPPHFCSPGPPPFAPRIHHFFPHRPPDFQGCAEGAPPNGFDNGVRQFHPPPYADGRFPKPELASHPPPRPVMFLDDQQQEQYAGAKTIRFEPTDITGANWMPVAHRPMLGDGAGAGAGAGGGGRGPSIMEDENICLTERLRRLAQSQASSSNIVLTSSGSSSGGALQPRR